MENNKTISMLVLSATFVLSLQVTCRAQDTEKLVALYFNEVRVGNFPIIPKQLSIAQNAKSSLALIEPYLKDSLLSVRAKAYTITSLAGTNSRQADLREDAVLKLLRGATDPNSGNAGLALDYLTNFLSADFNKVAKDSLRSLFNRKGSHFDKIIKLAGFAGLTDLTENIRVFTQVGHSQQIRWAAMLSLARMGDLSGIANMMTRVKKIGINDDVVYRIFPDLVYTRNREAFNYMIEAMESDAKNCLSPNAENEVAIPCGYRIMEQLAAAIENYPLELGESGDIKSDDYLASLAAVRYWFSQNKNYGIRTDRY